MCDLYRVQQFLAALSFSKEPVEEAVLKAYLSSAQIELFQRMSASEQRHAFAVLRTLQRVGHSDAVLAQAALLHDVGKVPLSVERGKVPLSVERGKVPLSVERGKVPPSLRRGRGRRVRLWHRVVLVLLQATSPALLRHLALNEPRSWRYPFFVQSHHASRGADMATAVGTDALAVALIRWHHTAPQESGLDSRGQAMLAALRSADEEN